MTKCPVAHSSSPPSSRIATSSMMLSLPSASDLLESMRPGFIPSGLAPLFFPREPCFKPPNDEGLMDVL
jgi:hypothetical protein